MTQSCIRRPGALAIALWLASLSPGFGTSIGLNFTGGRDGDPNYPPSPVTGTAGAFDDLDYSQSNWNNLPGPTGLATGVKNSSGATVGGMSVYWWSGATYTHEFAPFDEDEALMNGYLDDAGGPTPTGDEYGSWVIVSNIPYSVYHLVIYGASDDLLTLAIGAYAAGLPDGRLLTRRTYGGHPIEFTTAPFPEAGWHRIPPDQVDRDAVWDDPYLLQGDHVVFPNLTQSDLMAIAIFEGTGSDWKARGTIAAVQIVEASNSSNDGDTLPDEWELIHFGNLSEIDNGDPDGDGLVNTGEFANASNPNLAHSDDDLLNDDADVRAGFSPVLADSDGNGIPDDEDLYNGPDTDLDTMSDPWERLHFGDLSRNGTEDEEPDGLDNLQEHDARTDPNDEDTDDDGLLDGVETDHGPGSYVSPTDTGSSPTNPDTDVDSLSDGSEVAANPYVTDPTRSDTDSDGWLDQVELGFGTDPTDSNSVPVFVAGQFAVNFPCGNGARFEEGTTAADFLVPGAESAGAPGFVQQNWNNATVPAGSPVNNTISNLVDSVGASLGSLSVSYTAPTSWGVDGTVEGSNETITADSRMLAGYLDDGNVGGSGCEVIVSNIPYAMYDVVLYFTGDGADGSAVSSYTLENAVGQRPPLLRDPIHARNLRPTAASYSEVPDTSTESDGATRGNYTVFKNLRENPLTIVTDPAVGRAPLCAFQLLSRDPLTYPDLLDNDGMADAWETNKFPGMTVFDVLPGDDPDNDTLDNLGEFLEYCEPDNHDTDHDTLLDGAEVADGTDPTDPDTDDDGLGDEVETDTGTFVDANDTGTDPLRLDTDSDGLEDGEEVNSAGSDPNKGDTDLDRFGDQIEVAFGSDPNSSSSVPPVVRGASFQLRHSDYDTAPYDEQLEVTDEAGLIPYANWNDVAHQAAQPLAAEDQEGNATGMQVTWSMGGTYWPPDWDYGGASPDEIISIGYFDDQDACTVCGDLSDTSDGIGVSLTVSDVPYENYAVLLYRNSDEGPYGQYGTYTVNGVPKTTGDTSTFVALGGWVLGQTALLYTGLSDRTLSIRIDAGSSGQPRGSLCGFQILDVIPDPPSIIDFSISAGDYSLSWDSMSGKVYRVESESDLAGGSWSTEPDAASITATNATTAWSGAAAGNAANYRVKRNPSP